MSNGTAIVVPDWSLEHLRAIAPLAAALVFESFSEFYELFSGNSASIVHCLAEQLQNPASEIGINRLLFVEGEVAGVYAFIPSSETALRRLVGFRSLLRLSELKPDASVRALAFSRGVEPVPVGEALWTRLATAPRFRGRGLALRMSYALLEEASRVGYRTLYSHVRRDNDASLALHARLGFKPLGGSGYTHIALSRSLPFRP